MDGYECRSATPLDPNLRPSHPFFPFFLSTVHILLAVYRCRHCIFLHVNIVLSNNVATPDPLPYLMFCDFPPAFFLTIPD